MRPTRKSRSVNNWHDFSDIYSEKDVDNSKRENYQKRKLSDTSQWSKEELRRFYAAYREYGKDWKKVAAVVRNRSVEMVESIYTMNMAYLSLPEGTASVVGFIAMMLEHYSNLCRSDSEQERNDGATASQKTKKRARGKAEPGYSEASNGKCNAHSLAAASGYGCIPLMKRKHAGGSRPQAARKRTPRFPISYSCENIEGDKILPLSRLKWKKKAYVNDAAAAREIGLTLTEANAVENDRNDEHLEGSMKIETSELSRHWTYLKQSGQVATLVQKGRNIDVKKLDPDDGRENHLDDQIEVVQRSGALHEKLNRDARIASSSLQGPRKKSKKVHLSRDEVSAIEALQTLADSSLKMTSGGNEDESRGQIKEEKDDHFHEFGSLKATAGKSQRAKRRSSGVRVKGDRSISRSEIASTKSGKGSSVEDNAVPEMGKEANQSKTARKKRNMLTSKIGKSEAHLNNQISEISEYKARDVEKMNKSKRSSKNASSKLMKDAEQSSRTHPQREGSDPAHATPQICLVNKISLPTRVRSRYKMKMHQKDPQKQKDLKIPDEVLNEQSKALTALVHDTAFSLKDKLINCLSSHRLRRWCMYEWFYSAIDYPWFAKREFVDYLCHVGLGHIPKLTRAEWGLIRSCLGKPRRFSQQFLKEERKKLNEYRDSVRKHYTDLRRGTLECLPQDLARPLSVGQHVIAIHPKAREIHDGNVLTVDHSRCSVQFDQAELGVEFVMDIDCMPLNHLESISTPLARHMTCNKLFKNKEHQLNEQAKEYTKAFFRDEIRNTNCLPYLSPSTYPLNINLTKVTSENANLRTRIVPTETFAYQEMVYSQPCTLAQIRAKETDVQALAQSTCAYDKKEPVVFELKHVNNDLVDNFSLKESKPFKNLLVQLQEPNEQVSSHLSNLRQQNALQETILLSWPGSVANFGEHRGPLNSLDHSAFQPYSSGTHVNEIIDSSRVKARTMVNVAMQTMSSLRGRENTLENIDKVIDILNEQLPLDDSFIPLPPDPMMIASDTNEAQIPSELITQCVATLLMIQKCTERQFPPADIAQILQSAVTSLKPRCSQNLPAYAEIQRCMGRIRNEILSLLPT